MKVSLMQLQLFFGVNIEQNSNLKKSQVICMCTTLDYTRILKQQERDLVKVFGVILNNEEDAIATLRQMLFSS